METFIKILFILIGIAFVQQVTCIPLNLFDCSKVEISPAEYDIDQINFCANRGNRAYDGDTCVPLDDNCPKCTFGHAKDDNGCFLCHECIRAEDFNGLYQGDITLDDNMKKYVMNHVVLSPQDGAKAQVRGSAADNAIRLWNMYPDGDTFIVPYEFDRSLGSEGREAVEAAAADFAEHTCIRLVPRDSSVHRDAYITYIADNGCYSPIGVRDSDHRISLGSGCERKGVAIHETMHSLGFWHEQSRPDRDNYVIINWENIRNGFDFNFEKIDDGSIDSRGSAYDLQSVMHYQSTAFSTNGRNTITDINGNDYDAQRDGFVDTDIEQINALYGCGSIQPPQTTTTIAATTTATRPTTTEGTTPTTVAPPTTTTAPVTPITLPELTCEGPDLLEKRICMYLAEKHDCTDRFMTTYCCQSCKNLGGIVFPPLTCRDVDYYHCRAQAARGFCEKIPEMMVQICPRTCGLCL